MEHLSNTALEALSNSNFADNSTGEISAADIRDVSKHIIDSLGGWQVKHNTSSTPQSILANTATQITNDHAGTEYENKPNYITGDLLIANKVSLAEIAGGSLLHLSGQLDITTTTANTVVRLTGSTYQTNGTLIEAFEYDSHYYKTAGTYQISSHIMTYIPAGAAGGYMTLSVVADADASVLWKETIVRVTL